jgi:hypothetical protein
VGQDSGGNPIEIPSGLRQGRVHPVQCAHEEMFGARVCLVGDEDCFVRVGEEGHMAGGSIVHLEVTWGEYLPFLAYVRS